MKRVLAVGLRPLRRVVRAVQWRRKAIHVAAGSRVSLQTQIGRCTRINRPSEIGPCVIGSFVACGGRLVVRSSNHHTGYPNMQDWTQRHVIGSRCQVIGQSKGPVEIKSACWIGDSVIILPGVTIGYGAVIGAGSVVTKSVPDFAVAVGNPAKVIKYRFSPECIALLLKLQWWTWSVAKIRRNRFFFETDVSALSAGQLQDLSQAIRP